VNPINSTVGVDGSSSTGSKSRQSVEKRDRNTNTKRGVVTWCWATLTKIQENSRNSSCSSPTPTVSNTLRFVFNTRLSRKKYSMKTRSQPSKLIQPLDVSELENTKRKIVAALQQFRFRNTISRLQQRGKVDVNDNIIKLDPFIHTDGLLRVSGRLQRSSMEFILPKDCEITKTVNMIQPRSNRSLWTRCNDKSQWAKSPKSSL